MPSLAIVVSAGSSIESITAANIGELASPFVIAADGGYEAAQALPWPVDLIVGDLDSLSSEALRHATASGIAIESHPADKDATDLDLAIAAAADRGYESITVIDSMRGRLDHLLGGVALLASPRWHHIEMSAWIDGARVVVVPPGSTRIMPAEVGETISVFALDDARGVCVSGVKWELRDADLRRGATLGVSNVAVAQSCTIGCERGTLLVINQGRAS